MDVVIRRSLDDGVFMITVGTQNDTSRYGLEVAEKYEGVWATVGLHPNHLVKQEFHDEDEIATIKTREEKFDVELYRSLAMHPKCVGIGENGLDFYRIPEGHEADEIKSNQIATARAHFDLATEMNLPLSIHTRDAYKEQEKLIAEYVGAGKISKRGVIHCFSGSLEQAMNFIDLGFCVSVTGIVTFSKDLQKVVRGIPLEKLLIETDAPYLSPAPERGKRNEPWKVKYIVQTIAEIKGTSTEEVGRITLQNTLDLFDKIVIPV
jgi:TatD DNase family protein